MRMTKDEITLVVVVLLVFVAGAAAKHYRNIHPKPVPPHAAAPRSAASAGKAPARIRASRKISSRVSS